MAAFGEGIGNFVGNIGQGAAWGQILTYDIGELWCCAARWISKPSQSLCFKILVAGCLFSAVDDHHEETSSIWLLRKARVQMPKSSSATV